MLLGVTLILFGFIEKKKKVFWDGGFSFTPGNTVLVISPGIEVYVICSGVIHEKYYLDDHGQVQRWGPHELPRWLMSVMERQANRLVFD